MSEQETLYAMALTRMSGFNAAQALTLYRTLGSATAVYEHRADIADIVPGCTPRLLSALRQWDEPLRRAEAEMAFAGQHAIRALTIADEDYPQRLASCPDAPLVVYYRGTANLNAGHVINVVGTRHCTPYGLDLVHNLIAGLRRLCPETLVVSGLAYGIDIAAHRRSLDEGLPTVAVLAHGLDRIYPTAHRNTARDMLTRGGLVTEFMSGTNADKANFVRRNRIVAGMADATVVVESASKGGALITASIAQSYNRDVFAFPGAVGAPCSEGCNNLIRICAASLITSAEDLADAMGWVTEEEAKRARRQGIEPSLFTELSDEEQAVADLLRATNDLHADTIATKTNIKPGRMVSLLFQMEMKGLLRPLAGGTYHLII